MAQMPAHSKLPWKLGSQEDCFVPIICDGWHGLASVVVKMEGAIENDAVGEFNAALIVRAVNNHAALLAALEAGYLYALQWDGVLRIKNQETLSMMRSAIADATGRTDQDVQDDFESRAALAKQAP